MATAKNSSVKKIIKRSIPKSSTAPRLQTVHQNFTMPANLSSASSFLRSGQKPEPATQVKPGVADRVGPGTNNVPGTTEPALGFGTTLEKVLSPGVIPPRPEKYGTFAWRYPYSLRNVMYC